DVLAAHATAPSHPSPRGGELGLGWGLAGGVEQGDGVAVASGDRLDEGGQGRQQGAGALVDAGLTGGQMLALVALGVADRARRDPAAPAGGVVGGPPGQVAVEGADAEQQCGVAGSGPDLAAGAVPHEPGPV